MDFDQADASEAGDGPAVDSAVGEESGGEDDASEVAVVVVGRPAVDSAVEAALVVEQDVCAAHLFQLFSFLFQELIY